MENKLQVQYMYLKEIKPYKGNAKKHPKEQIAKIAESIKQFGFLNPILIDGNNVVVAGHGRALAAKKLGMKTVPVIKKENWTEEEVKAFRLIENKLNESEWDFSLLDQEIESLLQSDLTFDMSVFGFDTDLIEKESKSKNKKVEFEIKEKYEIHIICKDEKQMEQVYNKVKGYGEECKLVSTL